MITIDITVIIQIINILILIVVMNTVLYKPVRATLEKRKEKVDELANAIDTFTKNAECFYLNTFFFVSNGIIRT